MVADNSHEIFGTQAGARFSRGRLDSREGHRMGTRVWPRWYHISGDYNWGHGIATTLYYGYAVGGAVIKAIYPKDSNGSLGYLEFNYHF